VTSRHPLRDNVRVTEPARHEILLQRRCAGDVEACVNILAAVHIADGYPAFWPDRPAEWLVSRRERWAWIAVEAAQSVIGHVALHDTAGHPAERLWQASVDADYGPLIALSRLFVSPAARGQGVGRSLLALASDYAVSQGRSPVLDVAQDNEAAVRLYERRGWHRVGELAADCRRRIPVFLYVSPEARLAMGGPSVAESGRPSGTPVTQGDRTPSN
jgi:GNAT superfamily N-acetyltransferase